MTRTRGQRPRMQPFVATVPAAQRKPSMLAGSTPASTEYRESR